MGHLDNWKFPLQKGNLRVGQARRRQLKITLRPKWHTLAPVHWCFPASFDYLCTGLLEVVLWILDYYLALMRWLSTLPLCTVPSLETGLVTFAVIESQQGGLVGWVG